MPKQPQKMKVTASVLVKGQPVLLENLTPEQKDKLAMKLVSSLADTFGYELKEKSAKAS